MRAPIVLFSLLWLVGATAAADQVVITHKSLAAIPNGTNATSPKTTVSGPEFKKIEGSVKAVIQLLGEKTEWWDLGPDASYVSAEIHYRGKRYVINSWHPLYRDNPKIAVSETRGLVSVSDPEEKKRIEKGNSKKYKTIVGLFGLIKEIPQQDAPANAAPPRR